MKCWETLNVFLKKQNKQRIVLCLFVVKWSDPRDMGLGLVENCQFDVFIILRKKDGILSWVTKRYSQKEEPIKTIMGYCILFLSILNLLSLMSTLPNFHLNGRVILFSSEHTYNQYFIRCFVMVSAHLHFEKFHV